MKSSDRSQVKSFQVMDVMQEASILEAEGKSIIHMEVGQPSTGASREALEKLNQKMLNDRMGYTLALGIPELKKGISELYKLRYNIRLDPERVIITSGSSAAFILAFTAFFDNGDTVLIGEPGYPSYKNIIKSLGLIPELVLTNSESKFQLEALEIQKSKANGVLIASPSNPTGTIFDENKLRSVISAAKKNKMIFISDEIYHGINFGGGDNTALQFDDNCIVINSFSKYFFLTGWRIGWMVVPGDKVRTVERLAQNLFICPPSASQTLALYSLKVPEIFDLQVTKYKQNRDILMEALPKLGFGDIVKPDGAFYLYANIKNFRMGSDVLVKRILHEVGVALTPGTDFDSTRGLGTIRISYACSTAEVNEAVLRLTRWCENNFK